MSIIIVGLSIAPDSKTKELIKAVSPKVHVLDLSDALAEEATSPAAKAKVDEMLRQIDVLFLGRRPLNLAKRAPKLKWAQWSGSGIDILEKGGIFVDRHYEVTNIAGTTALPIAEHAFMFMLMWAKMAPSWLEKQRNLDNTREGARPDVIQGHTLGVLGLGRIGVETARLGKAFRMTVLATRRSAKTIQYNVDGVDELWPPEKTREMLTRCDYVVNALPLTKETTHVIGESELRAMKPTAFLVNVGRGPLVDEVALARALREKWIAGAGLDVFETEPLPKDSPLWSMSNVFITPHVAGYTLDSRERSVSFFIENLNLFLAGKPLKNVVDPNRGY